MNTFASIVGTTTQKAWESTEEQMEAVKAKLEMLQDFCVKKPRRFYLQLCECKNQRELDIMAREIVCHALDENDYTLPKPRSNRID